MWYFLDPDNRKEPPATGPYCCRCMKKLTVSGSMAQNLTWHSVTLHPVHPWVKLAPLGAHLIGSDCWKIVQQNPISEETIKALN